MKQFLPTLIALIVMTGVCFGQEEDPVVYGPSQLLRTLYYKLSRGPSKTGVDVRTFEACDVCGQHHDPDMDCIVRTPCPDCVVGKKKLFKTSIRCEYVVVAEVRYRWKTKWIQKEIPADCQEPVCKNDEVVCPNNVQDFESCETCEGRLICETTKSDPDAIDAKHVECQPGQTTIKVKYKSLVKEPYIVYRQIKRPIAIKQPCTEDVDVPVTRYEGSRVKK